MNNLCVLQNLKKVEYDPWPHIIIENALPEKIHDELLATLPNERLDSQEPKDSHGKRTWMIWELYEENFPVSNLWKEFIQYHSSEEFVNKVFDTFDLVSQKLPIHRKDMVMLDRTKTEVPQEVNYYTEYSFVKHPPINKISSRTPHTDNEKEIYAGLFYLKHPEDKSTGGDFCIHKAKNLRVNKDREYKDPGPIVKRCEYQSNNFVMFWNGKNTQHSVSARENATHPRWSINMIGRYMGRRNFKF